MQVYNFTRKNYLNILLNRLQEPLPLLQVLLGPRQVGKTTLAHQLTKHFDSNKVLYASADQPAAPDASWIVDKWQSARGNSNQLLILDEVQKVPRWSEVTKMLFDEDRLHGINMPVLILGSASIQLQHGLAESLLGRFELTLLPHWSFAECSMAFSWDLITYLQYGGYPAPVRMISEPERWQRFMIDSVIEPVIGKDLPAIRTVTKPAVLRQTMSLSLCYPAQEVALRKFSGELLNEGSPATVKGYLEMLEGAFLIRLLYKYSTRPISTKTSSPKIIPLCPALISCFSPPQRVVRDASWNGRVFESIIGARLSGLFREQLWYWRHGHHEVDFVFKWNDQLYGIEVKSSTFAGKTNGLHEFSRKFPNSRIIVLNQDSGKNFLAIEDSQNAKDFLAKISTKTIVT
jgi:uncharacterized protein